MADDTMKILIIATHLPVTLGRYMLEAFRRIGVDVRSIGNTTGTAIWNRQLAPDREWRRDGELDTSWPDWRPDLVAILDNSRYHHPRYHDVPHIVYGVDNHVFTYRQEGIAHYFMAHRRGPVMPVEGDDMTWLPCAYDPVFFPPSPIPWEQRRFDLSIIGVAYDHRIELVRTLRANLNLAMAYKVGPVYEEYRDIYHNTRISLCASFRGDVAIRVFETAAMGCTVLSDPCDDLPELAADGIVLYRDPAEAVERVRHLLAHPAEAQALADRSQQWALPHTWDARARFICDWYARKYGSR
jgi:hypothetical protein